MWFQRHEEPKTITEDYEQVCGCPLLQYCALIVAWSMTISVALNLILLKLFVYTTRIAGHIHLFRLWEVGPAQERRIYIWVPVPGGPWPELIHLNAAWPLRSAKPRGCLVPVVVCVCVCDCVPHKMDGCDRETKNKTKQNKSASCNSVIIIIIIIFIQWFCATTTTTVLRIQNPDHVCQMVTVFSRPVWRTCGVQDPARCPCGAMAYFQRALSSVHSVFGHYSSGQIFECCHLYPVILSRGCLTLKSFASRNLCYALQLDHSSARNWTEVNNCRCRHGTGPSLWLSCFFFSVHLTSIWI